MATARKSFTPGKPTPTDSHVYAAFIASVLAGSITAIKLIEKSNGHSNGNKTDLDYDDPNG
jgi:hypothetical protein